MGILTSQCCVVKTTEDTVNKSLLSSTIKKESKLSFTTSHKDDSPNSNESNCSPKEYYSNILAPSKRVLFSNFVNQRIFTDIYKINEKSQMEEQYNDIELYMPEKEEEITTTNISFEESNNRFLIEDCFYKLKYQLPNSFDHVVNLFKSEEEKLIIKNLLKYAIISCKNQVNNNIHRIDGMLLINTKPKPNPKVVYKIDELKQLIIITEKYIFDFTYGKDNKGENRFLLNSDYKISQIDYLSLSSDNTILIIHFIPNIGKNNFMITLQDLHNLAGCLCSSNLCDTVDYQNINQTRKISVILFNKSFEITDELCKCINFKELVNKMNSFLNDKLRLTFLSSDFDFFRYKYCPVRLKVHSKFIEVEPENGIVGDLIITNEELYILKYENGDFEIINKISYKKIVQLVLSNEMNSFVISDDINLCSY